MENENNQLEVQKNTEVIDTVNTEQAPQIEIMNTNDPNYQKQFMVDEDLGDDFFKASNQEVQENQESDITESPEEQQVETETLVTENPVFNSYAEWAKERGLEVNPENYDLENFGKEQVEQEVGKYYAENYLKKVDPRIKQIVENNLNLDQYLQQQQQLSALSATDPKQLFQAKLYDHLYNDAYQQGILKFDGNGQLAKDSMDYLVKQVHERSGMIGEEEITKRGQQLQQMYKQQLEQLPQHLVEQQKQQFEKEVEKYNNNTDQLITELEKQIGSSNSMVVPFSGQSEKQDFIKYAQEQIKATNKDGSYIVPLLDKLQNDGQFLSKMLRLAYLEENGYFTDLKNTIRKNSFGELGLFPKVGKGSGNKKTGKSKVGNVIIEDTANPDYQKRYK